MAEHPEAHFSEVIWEEIKEDQHAVDKKFWPKIYAMTVPMLKTEMGPFGFRLASQENPPKPSMPSLPQKLFGILVDYAVALFDCEFSHYPAEEIVPWTPGLSKRIEQRVIDQIDQIEKKSFASLARHATHQQMHAAVRRGLIERCKPLLTPVKSASVPITTIPTAQVQPKPTLSPAADIRSLADHLTALFEESELEVKDAAKALGVSPKSIYRHIHGEANPRREHMEAYEKMFSEAIGRPIKLKRQKRVAETSVLKRKVTEKSKP